VSLVSNISSSVKPLSAYLAFPAQHRTKLHSTNPLERLNKEVKRRADVVGIFPNEASIARLIGAVLLEQNDEWLLHCRYMQIEGMAELTPSLIDADPAKLPPLTAQPNGHLFANPFFHHLDGRDLANRNCAHIRNASQPNRARAVGDDKTTSTFRQDDKHI
jgi:Transposase, Mutator family